MNVRPYWIGILALSVVFLANPLVAQEPFSAEGIPPSSDFVYRKHYEQVEEIMATPDVAAREQKLTAFMEKLHPEAKIRQYMEAYFGQIAEAYQKAGQTAKATALTDKMAKLFPKSDAQLGPQFKAAFDAKDYAKAIELGERLRKAAPGDAQVLLMLAESYRATNNNAKVIELAPRVIDAVGPDKAIGYVVQLAAHHREKNDLGNAARFYGMALKAYPNRTPEGWTSDQWGQVKAAAYDTQGKQAWAAKDYRSAVAAYKNLLSIDPKNDGAYLYIGMGHWQLQELDEAEAALAKAVVLDKAASAKARELLEQLYKPRNNNSLDGLDDVLAKARADLRL